MPSTMLPTDILSPSYNAGTFTVDLYKVYAEQFGMTISGASIKNPTASSLAVFPSNSLEYFITYYDNTVFQDVSLSDAGILTYKLPAELTISDKTFMNIVFKVK